MTVTAADLLSNAEFVRARPRLEREAIANASARRVRLGDHLTFLFENAASVRWQVQEMCRVENIVAADAVQHELDTYNALLPSLSPGGSAELSATLLIEYTDEAERAIALRQLVGLHEHLHIEVDGPNGIERTAARFDGEQFNDQRVSAVQFVRFPLSPTGLRGLADLSRPASLVCTHPAHPAVVQLAPGVRGALIEDLRGA